MRIPSEIFIFISAGFLCVKAGAEVSDYNAHMQVTSVNQQHSSFNSPYEGTNSLSPRFDSQTSLTWTIFLGHRLWRGAEVYLNPEMAGGGGFNRTTGIAGFPNAEIYRVDDPTPKWNFERMFLKQVVALGDEAEDVPDQPNQLAGKVPVRRVTIVAGKFALNDYFDLNGYAHDPRTQFLNWSLMDQGAWDYAADVRGYSVGVMVELNQPRWAVRFAVVKEPVIANQLELDEDLRHSHGDNLEFEYRYKAAEQPGTVRALVYQNHARMGVYRTTIDTPAYAMDVTKSRALGRVKTGYGLNAEQALSENLGAFARAGWNDGHTETWAFTEIDESYSAGLSLKGTLWSRPGDTIGLAWMMNAISKDHKEYLEAGGNGFMIGDGQLNYAPEQIEEFYYLLKIATAYAVTGDFQYVSHPAYNHDRGPVSILSMRLHAEF